MNSRKLPPQTIGGGPFVSPNPRLPLENPGMPKPPMKKLPGKPVSGGRGQFRINDSKQMSLDAINRRLQG